MQKQKNPNTKSNAKPSALSAIAATAAVINMLVVEKKSLPDCLAEYQAQINPTDASKIQAYCYNILRRYEFYQFIVSALLDKKLKNKDQDIYHLIISGIMLLNEGNLPEHAAINETVNVTKKSKKSWSKNLVNALLRRYQREQQDLHAAAAKNDVSHYCCPQWLLTRIQKAYPNIADNREETTDSWQAILQANLNHPPMTLRVNQLVQSRDAYLKLLENANIAAYHCPLTQHGILLELAVPVEKLPLFKEGAISVQDSAAQLCAEFLAPEKNENLLDACAAPGGKTLHLLESCPEVKNITAIDISAKRLERVTENISRLAPKLSSKITLVAADAGETSQWWDEQPFDRILLDAPCSATGVIRRHPDIKRLREVSHIDELIKTQRNLLDKLWPLLKSGGTLLYATCSVLPEENSHQIKHFLSTHNDAQSLKFNVSLGKTTEYGMQLLPTVDSNKNINTKEKRNSDGFFYCLLQKK